ncbi:MAG: hypothetical protein ONB14_00915 [candidate division KSB1 bacterium]|nr:hypothetical protein [candidate division KSB1 bacterium]
MSLLRVFLHTEWISWFIHFLIFFVLMRWSGIKRAWAIILVFAIEVWEMLDWSLTAPLKWWMRLDTHLDIVLGLLGIWTAEWAKKLTGTKR